MGQTLDPVLWTGFFGLPESWARSPLGDGEGERIGLESVWKACQQLRFRYGVEIDRSPVMAAEGAFWARLEHSGNRIWINGHVLDRAPDPTGALEFLVHHELVHAVFVNKVVELSPFDLGLSEEQLADRIGIFALQVTGL